MNSAIDGSGKTTGAKIAPDTLSNAKSLRITAPTLLVADIERSIAFYRDQVGLTLFRTNDAFANFKMGDLILALWQLDHVQESIGYDADISAARFHNSIMACLLDSRAAVDAHYQRLRDNGVAFLYPPKAFPWNVYATYFVDPDGFMWEIFAWLDGGPEVGGHVIHKDH